MKRFIISILFVSVFCIGLGALVDKVGAKFKSDEKALALIRQARQAIGGESAVGGVKSMSIVGKTTRSFKADGLARTEQNETEINLQLPSQLMRLEKIENHDANGGMEKTFERHVQVEVNGSGDSNGKPAIFRGEGRGEGRGVGTGTEVHKIVLQKPDGTTEVLTGDQAAAKVGEAHSGGIVVRKIDGDNAVFSSEGGKTIASDGRHVTLNRIGAGEAGARTGNNDLLRLTLGLLLTAPEGSDVNYQMGGEADVDGTACNVVVAESGGSSYKIYLGKSSNLPVMLAYSGFREPQVVTFRTKAPGNGDEPKENMVFTRKVEGPDLQTTEFQVKFSDYRSVGGVQLPYRWTKTGGDVDETFDITTYEINPANISEKFNNKDVKVRMMKKPDGQ